MVSVDYRIFVEHTQYYTGCSWPTICGVGSTPHEALEDALDLACEIVKDDVCTQLRETGNDESETCDDPAVTSDETGELLYHCELTITD